MRIAAVTGTELFVGDPGSPRQVVQVEVDGPAGELRVEVSGEGVSGRLTVAYAAAGRQFAEVGVACAAPPGAVLPIRVTAEAAGERDTATARLVVAEPGWTVWMVSHFHYDPVWWNTQAAYTSEWDALRRCAVGHREGLAVGEDPDGQPRPGSRRCRDRDLDRRFLLPRVGWSHRLDVVTHHGDGASCLARVEREPDPHNLGGLVSGAHEQVGGQDGGGSHGLLRGSSVLGLLSP
jgi:hypothetical protein